MEWRVVARPLVVRKGRRMYVYAEVRILLPVEYAGRLFVVRPVGVEEEQVEQAKNETKPTWVSEAVRDVFKNTPT